MFCSAGVELSAELEFLDSCCFDEFSASGLARGSDGLLGAPLRRIADETSPLREIATLRHENKVGQRAQRYEGEPERYMTDVGIILARL